jgi:uncharacterized heparinase superfamily protein
VTFRAHLFATPFYDLLLRAKAPDGLAVRIDDPWPGEPTIADRLFQGRYLFCGEEVHAPNDAPWLASGHGLSWFAALHGFSWLRHFHSAGGDAATRHARALVASWIKHFPRWHALAWRADILGRRLTSWIAHVGLVVESGDATHRQLVLHSLARQARHLHYGLDDAPPGVPRLDALLGSVYAALVLPAEASRFPKQMQMLAREVAAQILPDGGHVSRNPTLQLTVLRDLVALRHTLGQAQQPVPEWLQHAIDRMTPMLRFFRHVDGALALFHGGEEESSAALDLTLVQADSRGKPLDSASFSGFERIATRRAVLIADGGRPPAARSGATPHAAPLAFEFSHGKDRLVVSCGAPHSYRDGALAGDIGKTPPMARALAATAAHSTLVVSDNDSLDVAADETASVVVTRDEQDSAVWLDLSHKGYRKRFGLTHHRRLYLAATGEDLRGQDSLDGPGLGGAGGRRFAIRFHLHPAAQASMLGSGATVLIKAGSGHGWQFRASGGSVAVEESVYFGRAREQRRCQQIVVESMLTAGEPALVKWAFSRVGG